VPPVGVAGTMTTPDLAALRALVEAVECRRVTTAALHAHMGTCDDCHFGRPSALSCSAVELYAQLRAAVTEMDIALPAAQAALKRMEETPTALRADETGHLHRCLFLLSTEPPRWACAKGCAVQRAKGAEARVAQLEKTSAQLMCDAAYWRRRARTAEVSSVQQEARRVGNKGGRDE